MNKIVSFFIDSGAYVKLLFWLSLNVGSFAILLFCYFINEVINGALKRVISIPMCSLHL